MGYRLALPFPAAQAGSLLHTFLPPKGCLPTYVVDRISFWQKSKYADGFHVFLILRDTWQVSFDRFTTKQRLFTGGIRTRVNQVIWQSSVPNWASFHASGGIPYCKSSGTVWFKCHDCEPEPSPLRCLYPTMEGKKYHFKNTARFLLFLKPIFCILSRSSHTPAGGTYP